MMIKIEWQELSSPQVIRSLSPLHWALESVFSWEIQFSIQLFLPFSVTTNCRCVEMWHILYFCHDILSLFFDKLILVCWTFLRTLSMPISHRVPKKIYEREEKKFKFEILIEHKTSKQTFLFITSLFYVPVSLYFQSIKNSNTKTPNTVLNIWPRQQMQAIQLEQV